MDYVTTIIAHLKTADQIQCSTSLHSRLPGLFSSELMERFHVLVYLPSTNSKVNTLWPWPHLCSQKKLSCYVMLVIFLILVWTTWGSGLVIVKSVPSKECVLLPNLGGDNSTGWIFSISKSQPWLSHHGSLSCQALMVLELWAMISTQIVWN